MRRRDFISGLSIGAGCLLAGCVDGGCSGGTSVQFERVDGTAIANETASGVDDTREMTTELVTRSLEGDEPVIETLRRGPLSWLRYLERNGQFYEIEEETVTKGRVSGPEYELSRDRETDDGSSSTDTVSFTDLPRHDQWRVGEAADFNVERIGGMRFSIPFVAGYLRDGDQNESRLAAGVDVPYIEFDGSYAELERTGEGTATAQRLRYTAERIAGTADEFADHVLERRGIELNDLSDEVRLLLEDVEENGGRLQVCDHELDEVDEETAAERRATVDRLESRLDTLAAESRSNDFADEPLEYVRYEGEWYRIDLTEFAV